METGFSFASLRLEPDGTLRRGEASIHLPPKELAALRLLLEHAGEIVTSNELKEAVWGDVHVTADSVPRCMSSLRARLEPEQCIQTVYKRGYRLTAPVRRHGGAPSATLPRLAILPFDTGYNVAGHLGPAIAEEATARLTATRTPMVSVLARDSVFTLARQGLSAQQIGEALHADLVLTGTLLALPSHFRLRAEMVRVQDGTQIWVEDMLVGNDRAAALDSELVERLAFRLGHSSSISLAASDAGDTQEPVKRDAYENFQRGHHEWQTLERHRMQDGIQHLLKAAELDPSLLAAQVDLVNACVTQTLYGFMSPLVAAEQIRRIADGIPDLAENAPAILPALGWVSFHVDHDLPTALQMFAQCAHLPHDPWTTRLRVMFALSRHRFDEACALLRAALIEDPFAPWLHARLAWAHHLSGHAEESVDQIERSLALFPKHESSPFYGAVILAFNGNAPRAARLAEELAQGSPYFDIATAVHAYAVACAGNRREARSMLERLQWLSRERFVLTAFNPAVHAVLGDEEAAIADLRAGAEAHCPWFFQMLADPRLKPLHGHPQFKQMRATLDQLESAASQAPQYRC